MQGADMAIATNEAATSEGLNMPVINARGLIDNRAQAIREMHAHSRTPRAQLDLSGGVDSAVMLGLLVHAIGPERITAVYTGIHSSSASRQRAQACAASFGVSLVELDLSDVFDELSGRLQRSLVPANNDADEVARRIESDATVLGSFRSCLRAPIGRALNRMTGRGIRHGTGNECEDRFLRFYQKGGDGEVDTNPIAMLAKGEVYQLAQAIGVPRSIIDATPSPDLHGVGDAHNDETELLAVTGVAWTYSRVDSLTGDYVRVGSIERMSRFLDTDSSRPLLADGFPSSQMLAAMAADAAAYFPDADMDKIRDLLRSCRALERSTRHKANPNITSLGTRAELVESALLSDELPSLRLTRDLPLQTQLQ